MEEALYRLKLAADAGADVCFIEGVRTAELLKSTVAALAPKPVLVNVISGGLTPSFTTKEAEALGAKIISECSAASSRARAQWADDVVHSLLACELCRGRSRHSRRYGLPQEDRNGLHECEGHGSKGVLRGHGYALFPFGATTAVLLTPLRQASTTSSDSMPRQVARRSRSSE